MSSNLVANLKCSLSKFSIREVYAWSHSTVNIHWLKDNGEYKVSICTRAAKIKEKSFINWKYVPAKQNPADLGSRRWEIGKLGQNWREDPVRLGIQIAGLINQ